MGTRAFGNSRRLFDSLVFHRYGPPTSVPKCGVSGNDRQKFPTTSRERELAAMRAPPVHGTIAAAR
jgi:hypothetical protein